MFRNFYTVIDNFRVAQNHTPCYGISKTIIIIIKTNKKKTPKKQKQNKQTNKTIPYSGTPTYAVIRDYPPLPGQVLTIFLSNLLVLSRELPYYKNND